MIFNRLVLYCIRLEQAMLWETCKRKRCATSNCLFKKISKKYGENLWSPKPLRIAQISSVEENLEILTQPLPIVRMPILPSLMSVPRKIQIIDSVEIEPDIQIEAEPHPTTSLTDIVRQGIEEIANQF